MTDQKVSQLPQATSLTGTELVYAAQGGNPVGVPTSLLASNAAAGLATQTALNAGLAAQTSALGTTNTAVTALQSNLAATNTNVSTNTTALVATNATVATHTATLATHTGQITALQPVPVNLTLANLRQAYSGTNITGSPVMHTIDCGMAQYSPVTQTWYPMHPFTTAQGAIPFILPSSGSVANNGAVTLTTALPNVYSNGCYMYFGSGVIYATNTPGMYWTVMSSTTVGTVYNNIYIGNQPAIPTTLVPFVTTGPGAYTQITGQGISMVYANVPGGVMGNTGQSEARFIYQTPSNANNKQVNCSFGGTNLAGDIQTTANIRSAWHMVRNQGLPTNQTCFASTNTADIGTGTSITRSIAVNTNIGQVWSVACVLTAATDFIILESYSFTTTPSLVLDAHIPPTTYIPSAAVVPPPAAALGLSLSWLTFPQVSDVSFALTDTTHNFYAGQYYNANPPYSSSGGYLTNQTINGVNYLSINQLGDGVNPGITTQNQSSIQGQLKSASTSVAFYFEIAVKLLTPNGWSNDNWPQVYLNPIEHNSANGSAFPYVELDIDEGFIFALNSYNSYNGPCTSFLDWVTGSGGGATTTNNANAGFAGPNIDRTQENIWGFSFDPVAQVCNWYVNGVLQWTKSCATQISAGRMTNKHYSIIFGAGQHGNHVPFSMLVRYVALWGG